MLRKQLLQRPLLDVLGFVVFELCDELDGARENAAFVLLAAGHDFGDFVDAFVDGLAAATFDWGAESALVRYFKVKIILTFFVIVSAHFVPLLGSNRRLTTTRSSLSACG